MLVQSWCKETRKPWRGIGGRCEHTLPQWYSQSKARDSALPLINAATNPHQQHKEPQEWPFGILFHHLSNLVGTLHGPSRQLEGSKTAGFFQVFQRIVLNWKWHKGEWGAVCAMALSGSEITSVLSGPLWCSLSSLSWKKLGEDPNPFGAGTGLSLSSSSHEAKFGGTAQLNPIHTADKFSVQIKAGQGLVGITAWGFEGKIVCKIEINVSVLPQCLETWRQTVLAHLGSSYLHFHSAKPLPSSVSFISSCSWDYCVLTGVFWSDLKVLLTGNTQK